MLLVGMLCDSCQSDIAAVLRRGGSDRAESTLWLQILFYPTAIGTEPQDTSINSYQHW